MSVTSEEILQILRDNEVFGVLDQHILELVAEHGTVREYKKGETIIVQDEPGDRVFILIRGTVRVYRRSHSGEVIELERRRSPQMFGELAVLDQGPRTASVEATTKVFLLTFPSNVFIGIIQREPATVVPLFQMIGRMVRNIARLTSDLMFLDIKARIAKRLLELADDEGNLTHDRRVTQIELAQMVGAARQTVNGALHVLVDENTITVSPDGIRIVDREQLRRLADA